MLDNDYSVYNFTKNLLDKSFKDLSHKSRAEYLKKYSEIIEYFKPQLDENNYKNITKAISEQWYNLAKDL